MNTPSNLVERLDKMARSFSGDARELVSAASLELKIQTMKAANNDHVLKLVQPVVEAGNSARMRASGMATLLSEILNKVFIEDDDLVTRIKMALEDQEQAAAVAP